MQILRYGLRLTGLLIHIIIGIVLTALFAGLLRQSYRKSFYQQLVRWWLGYTPRILGVNLRVYGTPATTKTLMVANHISWLDITILGGVANPRFLSKQDVRQWPVIGWLAAKAGTLFINRGKAGAATQAISSIQEALQESRPVLLFPEGTTTTGDDVRTFHGRLLAPAIDTHVPIQPVAIRYPGNNGQTNPVIPYVDEQSLLKNLLGLLGATGLKAEIHFLPEIQTAGQERKMLASLCEQQIRTVVKSVKS